MKKLLLVFALAALVYGTQAQEINWGARLGMNISKLNEKDSWLGDDYKSRVGFHIGVTADYEFLQSMFIESGLYITTKGAKWKEDNEKDKYNITYLQLPILYSYKYDLGNDLKLYSKIGPYFALGLAAKNVYDDGDKETIKGFGKSADDGSDDKTDLKRGDVGLQIGIGISKGKYYLGLNYELGLVNIDAYSDVSGYDGKVHTRNFNISLGYNF